MRMSDAPATVAETLRAAARRIDRVDAELLLLHLLGRERIWLFTDEGDVLRDADASAFEALVVRREAGEPIAYLTGTRGFWTLDLLVTPDTLIPRPETELLVELALARISVDADARIADLGTGSGAIALAIASERPHARAIATDASEAALAIAQQNAERNYIDNIEFRMGSWFAPLAGERFDIIVSNPPYIESDDPHLSEGDLRFEPATALASGIDGLDDLRIITFEATSHLKPDGWLLVEHGWNQGEPVRDLFEAAGFIDIQTVRDLEDRDRITLGRRG